MVSDYYCVLSQIYAVGTQELCQTCAQKGVRKKGMILPFQPLAMTFHNVNYFVDMPKVCLPGDFTSI